VAGQAEDDQVIIVQRRHLNPARPEGEGAQPHAVQPHEVDVRARAAAAGVTVQLHDPGDAVLRVVDVRRLEQTAGAKGEPVRGDRGRHHGLDPLVQPRSRGARPLHLREAIPKGFPGRRWTPLTAKLQKSG